MKAKSVMLIDFIIIVSHCSIHIQRMLSMLEIMEPGSRRWKWKWALM
ncbi:CLUMA_CG011747, isoform A [Clunio marinus]|uniref:CLUMA_CG011747, isoform A n=1 Tax=Clunio marinus TaxID=568069 RepID=A0A1J1IFS6_9DIPT|nr:CLUMA_CG011747, isoform A [Clunio marinus]